jgi:hypothetical protein
MRNRTGAKHDNSKRDRENINIQVFYHRPVLRCEGLMVPLMALRPYLTKKPLSNVMKFNGLSDCTKFSNSDRDQIIPSMIIS